MLVVANKHTPQIDSWWNLSLEVRGRGSKGRGLSRGAPFFPQITFKNQNGTVDSNIVMIFWSLRGEGCYTHPPPLILSVGFLLIRFLAGHYGVFLLIVRQGLDQGSRSPDLQPSLRCGLDPQNWGTLTLRTRPLNPPSPFRTLLSSEPRDVTRRSQRASDFKGGE
jgi:hypothetical protein